MSDPNVEAFKVRAHAELRRLLQRYVGQENTPALRASVAEMVEAKLRDIVERDFPTVGQPKIEIEPADGPEGQLTATLRLVPAHPVVEEIADDLDEAVTLECDQVIDTPTTTPAPPFDWETELHLDVVAWAWEQFSSRFDPEDCSDNHRVARCDSEAQMATFREIASTGCCGSSEWRQTGPDGHEYMLGCNYGH